MYKIFKDLCLSMLFVPLAFGQGAECYGNRTNVVRLQQNSVLKYDFSVNGEIVASDLNCFFKGNAANCQSSDYNLDVMYSDTFKLDPTTMTLLSSTTGFNFQLRGPEEVISYKYDFTKPGTNCIKL